MTHLGPIFKSICAYISSLAHEAVYLVMASMGHDMRLLLFTSYVESKAYSKYAWIADLDWEKQWGFQNVTPINFVPM